MKRAAISLLIAALAAMPVFASGQDGRQMVIEECERGFSAPAIALADYPDKTIATKFLSVVTAVLQKIPAGQRFQVNELVLLIMQTDEWNAASSRPGGPNGHNNPLAFGICISRAMLAAFPKDLLEAAIAHEIYHLYWYGTGFTRILTYEAAADRFAAQVVGPDKVIAMLQYMLSAPHWDEVRDAEAIAEIRMRICLMQYEHKMRSQPCQ